MATEERVRLHITPFNPDLLDRYIPPSLKPQATHISFHAIETFPERGFGYVELPTMEAQKLKKKLNGSTLKGAKVKIEEAKPEKKRKSSESVEEEETKLRKKAKREKRVKEDGVIPGHELEEGRHVKRGWTEDANAKKKQKKAEKGSLEGKKMKFKTEVPLNKVPTDEKSKEGKKKDGKEKPPKKGKKAAVVKEFSKSSKPNTTGALKAQPAVSYVDGLGWVNKNGNVVEEENMTKKQKRAMRAHLAAAQGEKEEELEQATEQEDAAQQDLEEDTARQEAEQEAGAESGDEDEEVEVEASSPSSPDSSSPPPPSSANRHEDTIDRHLNEAASNTFTNAAVERDRQKSTPVADILPSAEAQKEIHPLEALFKRSTNKPTESPKPKKPAPIDTSFSFFDTPDDEEMADEGTVPQTPHTKQDLEWRSIRSAAPTPDTAAIGKRFTFLEPEREEEDEDEEMGDVDVSDVSQPEGEKEESEFRKWFYENRGDLNRGWKKRRREERKAERQRENRQLNRKIA